MKYQPRHPGKPLPAHYSVRKGEGEAVVRDWQSQIPAWQADRARVIDAIVTRELPSVAKAVKWHGAWYGRPGAGWFLALNTFKTYLKLTFFNGCDLVPVPPDALAQKPASALNLKETMPLDGDLLALWVRQSQAFPGLFRA